MGNLDEALARRNECLGCKWDSAKRYENRLCSTYDGYIPAVSVRAYLGPRPEHRCGRRTLTQLLNRDLILAINTFRIGTKLARRMSSAELKRCLTLALEELELEGE